VSSSAPPARRAPSPAPCAWSSTSPTSRTCSRATCSCAR
jgi:hypothetical protein